MNAKQVKTAVRIAKQFTRLYNSQGGELLGIHDNWNTPEVFVKFSGLLTITEPDNLRITVRGKWDHKNPWEAETMIDGVRFYAIFDAAEFAEKTGEELVDHLRRTDNDHLAELYQEYLNTSVEETDD